MKRQAKATILLMLFISSQLLILLQVTSLQWYRLNEQNAFTQHHTPSLQFHFSLEAWSKTRSNSKDEISINGHMFDIKKIQYLANEVIITGHFDHHEDHLLHQLQSNPQKKNATTSAAFAGWALFFESPTTFIFFNQKTTSAIYPSVTSTLHLAELKQLEQPPQTI